MHKISGSRAELTSLLRDVKGQAKFWNEVWEENDAGTVFYGITIPDNSKVLDVGCGNLGAFSNTYLHNPKLIVGIDISAQSLRGKKVKDIDVVNATAHMLPFNNRSFDAVLMNCTFPLLGEFFMAAMHEAARVADKIIFDATHLEHSLALSEDLTEKHEFIKTDVGTIFRMDDQIDRVFIDEEDVKKIADRLGFKVSKLVVMTQAQYAAEFGDFTTDPYFNKKMWMVVVLERAKK